MSNFKVSNNGGDDWLICWTGQDEKGVHWNVTTNQVHASELFQFSKGAEEDARLIAKLLDMHYTGQLIHTESIQNKLANYDAQADEIKQLKADRENAYALLRQYNTPMPCGHLGAYAVNGEDGTQYCALCEAIKLAEKMTDMDDDSECPYCSKTEWGFEKHDEHCVFSSAYKIKNRGTQ